MIVQWTAAKYEPVGRCIYCGSTSNLTDEHIVPFALLPKGGDWFLPKASCPDCADITKRFEGQVLGGMFGPLREKMNLKSRRKKTGRVTVQYRELDGTISGEEVDLIEYPAVVLGLLMPIPGIVLANEPTNDGTGDMVVRGD